MIHSLRQSVRDSLSETHYFTGNVENLKFVLFYDNVIK